MGQSPMAVSSLLRNLVGDTAELWIAPVINVGWERCVGCITRTRNCPWHSSQWYYIGFGHSPG